MHLTVISVYRVISLKSVQTILSVLKCIKYFIYTLLPPFVRGNWELAKSIVGTKFERSHVCLHSQAGNRLW